YSVIITGFEKSSLGSILKNNLQDTHLQYHPDPYPKQNLFYRSDNATLARLGVPAHTISTSEMDSEPHYHKVSDEVSTLDLANMTNIIQSIALSTESSISGSDTPTRVEIREHKVGHILTIPKLGIGRLSFIESDRMWGPIYS